MSPTLEQLRSEFDELDLSNVYTLIDWLCRLFDTAQQQAIAIPFGKEVADRIGREQLLAPDFHISILLPPEANETEWLLIWCLNALVSSGPPLGPIYRHCVLNAKIWLAKS